MRLALPVAVLLLAGCLGGVEAPPEDALGNETGPTAPTRAANATGPPPLIGERGPPVTERFLFAANHSLDFLGDNVGERPVEKVPESFTGSAFYTQSPVSVLKPWSAFPAMHAYEVTQDVEITLRFVAAQPAITVTKGVIPPVGGWLGTAERWAVYFSAPEAPDTLEAGKEYVMRMKAKMPDGGLFVREGEAIGVYTYLGYQRADNAPLDYVVGGPDPAMVVVPHVHFNVTAPNATVVLTKEGAKSPNPTLSTVNDPQPTDFALDVPAGTAYLVAEVYGEPAGGGPYDLDLALLSGSATLGAATGPGAREAVVLGPTALAKAGGKLTARVAAAGAAGGSFKLVVTAFGP